MSLCFTDLSPGAAWMGTFLHGTPWNASTPPHYIKLIGFHLLMVVPDLLHTYNLGIGRDLAGSILKVILQDETIFTGSDIKSRMECATESLRVFAKAGRHVLKLKKFSKSKLSWESKKYPELKGSGSDCHIVCIWLEDVLKPHQHLFGDFLTMLWSSNQCLRLLYEADWFLKDSEKRTVETLSKVFLTTYLRMAVNSLDQNKLLFRVRPKFHMFWHLTMWPRHVNISKYSCWMDEDWLRKVAKVMQLSAVKTSQKRVLQRWLLSVPQNLAKVRLSSSKWLTTLDRKKNLSIRTMHRRASWPTCCWMNFAFVCIAFFVVITICFFSRLTCFDSLSKHLLAKINPLLERAARSLGVFVNSTWYRYL